MTTPDRNSLAVIGAGPVGLEAALAALDQGFDVHVFEQGEPGSNPLAWGHVRLFTPWRMNLGPASVRHLEAAGWKSPDLDAFATGDAYATEYLQHIARLPELKDRLHNQFDEYRDPKAVVFNPDVYRAMIGDDPEWTLGGTLAGVELLAGLSNYKGPALIMGGRYDRICPPINQLEIADALENAQLVIFEHSGHAPFIEEPLRFLTVVSEFIREVSAR